MNNTKDVQQFILANIENHPRDIAMVISENFGFSRQRANEYLRREIQNGNIIKTGYTRWTQYFLANGKHIEFTERILPNIAEDKIWSKYVKPIILSYNDNIQRICNFGFTEIFNNSIDHSDGTIIFTDIEIVDNNIIIKIIDNGIGIFKKIQTALNLDSPKESLLHLSKGKFTTDPSKHTGFGIFFTSRMFDSFSIFSGDMCYYFKDEGWFLSHEKDENFGKGTLIEMIISTDSKRLPKDIIDKYSDEDFGFSKTIVAVALSADPNDPHVSRSQAKRLLMGLEKFHTVVLDFKGVVSVGQAFVDEIFRVFQNEYPHIKIHYLNANEDTESMIKRGLSND